MLRYVNLLTIIFVSVNPMSAMNVMGCGTCTKKPRVSQLTQMPASLRSHGWLAKDGCAGAGCWLVWHVVLPSNSCVVMWLGATPL